MTLNFRLDRVKSLISESTMPLLDGESISNAVQVTIQLMNYLKIPITNSTIQTRVEEHMEFPSLISVSDALHHWNVKNIALKVEKENLGKLPIPFIAHLDNGTSLFETVTKVTESDVSYLTLSGIQRKKRIETFLSAWTGVVLAIQPPFNYKEIDYDIKKRIERWRHFRKPFMLISAILLAVMFVVSISIFYKAYFYYTSILFLLKVIGLFITLLLLSYELNNTSSIVRRICTLSRRFNCQAVLGSKAAKIFGRIGWNEIGFFYFAGGLIYLLSSMPDIQESIEMLCALNFLSLPYILYSVFYQWRIAKVWCPLCLLVQGLLLVEFFNFLIGYPFHLVTPILTIKSLISMVISFYLPVLFWVFSKRFIVKAKEGQVYRREFLRLKHNIEIFNTVLAQQKKVTLPPEDLGLLIGNDNSTNKIVMVSNPSCIACQVAHKTIKELLLGHKNLKVQMLFISNGSGDSAKNEFITYIMALNEIDREKALLALDEWYKSEIKKYKEIESKFPLTQGVTYDKAKMLEMDRWCRHANISATPTFFIRGHQLPAFYNLSDLSYLLV